MFTTSGRTITFPGFLRAYVEDTDDDALTKDDAEKRLPQLARGDGARRARLRRRRAHDHPAGALHRTVAGQGDGGARRRPAVHLRLDHADDPGPRVRLEEGRRRSSRPGRRSRSSACSSRTSRRLVDYGFTASVENDLDDIANGERSRVDWLRRFYFGADDAPTRLAAHLGAGRAEAADRVAAGGDRRARRELDPARRRRRSSCASAGTGRTCSAATARQPSARRSRRTSRRTS